LPTVSQQPTTPSTSEQVSTPPLDELLVLLEVLVVVLPLDDEELAVVPPPRHSTLQLAWRQVLSAPSATLLLQDAGGVALPRQLVQEALLDWRPHPMPPLVELPVVAGPPLVAVVPAPVVPDPAKTPLSVLEELPVLLPEVTLTRPPAPLVETPLLLDAPPAPPVLRLLPEPAAQAAANGTRARTKRV
jgi:hypothetical protein